MSKCSVIIILDAGLCSLVDVDEIFGGDCYVHIQDDGEKG